MQTMRSSSYVNLALTDHGGIEESREKAVPSLSIAVAVRMYDFLIVAEDVPALSMALSASHNR